MNFLRRHPLASVLCAGLAIRLLFILFFVSSPFRFFHTVPGLDMQTLLNFGEWGSAGNMFFLTPHRLQTFIFWKLNSGTHPVLWHVLFQALLGSAGAVLLAGAMLKLCRNRLLGAAAGFLWALNPVELMYEFTTLQDSLINFVVILAFYTFLIARKYHFRPLYALGAGVVTGVCSVGRPVALGFAFILIFWCAWYLHRRRITLNRASLFCAGVLTLWITFAGVNLVFGKHFTCFFNPVSYAVSVNTSSTEPENTSNAKRAPKHWHTLAVTAGKMICRIPKLWSPVEQPENLNIYFLRKKLPILNLPFEFIMIFAAAGFILLLTSGRWKKKEGVILLPILSLAFFLCIREPIGRYRLLMLPWFIMLGVWLVQYALSSRKRKLAALLLLLAAAIPALSFPRPLRAADFSAWGWALEGESGKITDDSMRNFITAWQIKADTGNAVNVITRAIRTNNRNLAESTAAEWVKKSDFSSISCYYAAVAAIPVRSRMNHFLKFIRPEELSPLLRFRYHIMCGDISRAAGKTAEASKHYSAALALPAGSPAMRRYAQQFQKKQDLH